MRGLRISIIAAFALLVFGAIVIWLSYKLQLWANVPWDRTVVGLGISIISVSIGGLALNISLRSVRLARESDRRLQRLADLVTEQLMKSMPNISKGNKDTSKPTGQC